MPPIPTLCTNVIHCRQATNSSASKIFKPYLAVQVTIKADGIILEAVKTIDFLSVCDNGIDEDKM